MFVIDVVIVIVVLLAFLDLAKSAFAVGRGARGVQKLDRVNVYVLSDTAEKRKRWRGGDKELTDLVGPSMHRFHHCQGSK